jgi:hypothetical protein
MKKTVSLILVILMLVGSVITALAAEQKDVNIETFFYDYGYRNAYIGLPAETAPTLDGAIGDGEYTYTRTIKQNGSYAVALESDLVEYMAYDSEWFYYAYTLKQSVDGQDQSFQFKVADKYIFNKEETAFHSERTPVYYALLADGTIKTRNAQAIGGHTPPVWDRDMFVAASKDKTTKITTYELKFSRAYFAEQIGFETEEFKTLAYILYTGKSTADQWNWHGLTQAEKDALAGKGLSANWTYHIAIMADDPENPTATTVVTDATTALETTALSTTAEHTTEIDTASEEKSGCGATLAISALVMIPTLAGGVVLTSKKRKED